MHQNLLRRRLPDRWAVAVDLVEVEKILKGLSSFLPVYPIEQFLEEVFYEDLFSFLARNRTKIDNVYRGSARDLWNQRSKSGGSPRNHALAAASVTRTLRRRQSSLLSRLLIASSRGSIPSFSKGGLDTSSISLSIVSSCPAFHSSSRILEMSERWTFPSSE